MNIVSGNSIACQDQDSGFTFENHYWRAFDMPTFGITGSFDVCDVQIGIEAALSVEGSQPLNVNLYSTPAGAFPGGTLTAIGSSGAVSLPDQDQTILTIPVAGTVPPGQALVVEVVSPDGTVDLFAFFIGSNADGQTAPSYLSALNCSIATPTDLALLGHPDMHIAMTVHGTEIAGLSALPHSLVVDPMISSGVPGNGVLEIAEGLNVAVVPGWTNTSDGTISLTGVASNFTGPGAGVGAFYALPDVTADYGVMATGASADCLAATGNCYLVNIGGNRRDPSLPVHTDATMDEEVTPVAVPFGSPRLILKTWTLHIGESFTDVSNDLTLDPFYPSIETILHHGVTGGCGDGSAFCPGANVLRQEMAPFLLKGFLGSGYIAPDCAGAFSDVPCPATPEFPYSNFIEDLSTRGITGGCAVGPPALYCPGDPVTRAQMAPFLIKTLLGGAYTPPDCTGLFSDVPCPVTPEFPYSNFIEDLSTRGITAGCQVGPPALYCPDQPVTREQMAAFLTRTFSLVLYGP